MKCLGDLLVAVALTVAVFASGLFGDSGERVNVLFVGNSYTTSNDLPGVFAAMGSAGGYDVEAKVLAQGGAWLRDQVSTVEAALAGDDWDYVVLHRPGPT